MPREEVLLMAGAILLYLYDSALLLHVNEGILAPAGAGRWRIAFGSSHMRLRGKELFVPNPLTPHRPLFRLTWSLDETPRAAPEDWDDRCRLFRPLAPLVWGMVFAAFVLLPLGLFTRLGDAMVLGAITLLYLIIVGALVWLGLRRRRFDLSTRRFASLAAEALLCAPFALNLVRKLSLQITAGEDLVLAARRLQPPAEWQCLRRQCIVRLEERIDEQAPDSPRIARLEAQRRLLAQEPDA